MAQQQEVGRQEGSRWINRRPEPDEFAKWFAENVRMHDGLEHAHYLPGITLIPNKEKVKQVVIRNGTPEIVDVEQLVYAPYPKVETRIAYFWDLMALHPEWLGKIKLVPTEEPNKHLPEGFFHMPVANADKVVPFIGVSYRVEILERRGGKEVIDPPAGTKMVPLLKRTYSGVTYPDENAIHKAQTGGIGRALGFAGMLVVPGAGIATAEDMLEFLAEGTPPELPAPTELEDNGAAAGSLEELVKEHIARLESEFPQAYEEARAWAAEKGYGLDEPPETALRGLERQLRSKLKQAEAK